MNNRKSILAFVLIVLFAALLIPFLAKADDPDDPTGVVNLGDRVVYFTDDDNDGQFEKNVAIVIDDPRAAAAVFKLPVEAGQKVNLRVFANGKSRTRDFEVFLVKRGRALGQYEALVTSNR